MKTYRLNNQADYVLDTPAFGVNYGRGYTGFTCPVRPGMLSRGIAYFTRFDQLSAITVTHALTVTGPDTCVEALADRGVVETRLSSYFGDPDTLIFFRKPRHLDAAAENIICAAVYEHVGDKYDTTLLAAQLYSGTFFGRLAALVSDGRTDAFVAWLLDHPDRWICSEYVAWALNKVAKLEGHGCLRYPAATINPRELFEDQVVYCPWHSEGGLSSGASRHVKPNKQQSIKILNSREREAPANLKDLNG